MKKRQNNNNNIFFYHKIASCSCWCSRCLLFYVHDHARYCVLLKQAREADEMTCRSYFPLFDVAVLFPLFYYNSKKKLSLSLVHRPSSFSSSFFFSYIPIIYCADNARSCVQSIIHLRQKKNGMECARK